MSLDALILAGGRASRLDGADKPGITVDGSTLLEKALTATDAAGARTRVVVGPERALAASVRLVREDPPFGGPVAAVAAGLSALDAGGPGDLVLILAADLPHASDAVRLLLAGWTGSGGADGPGARDGGDPGTGRAAGPRDGAHLVDRTGREQWLCGVYRREALDTAVTALGGIHDVSVRRLLASLTLEGVDDVEGLSADIDTAADLATARAKGTSMTDDRAPLPPEALDAWAAALASKLGLDPADVPTALVLDLARDVAHGVARPAAPLSAFLAGLAAGRAGGDRDAVESAVTTSRALAADWTQR